MEPWQRVWRKGIVGQLPRRGLEALGEALRSDDRRLIQGATTNLPPLADWMRWPIGAACAIGFTGWQGLGLERLGQVLAFFEETCDRAEEILGEPGSSRQFVNWYDTTPRPRMRRLLLAEVERALRRAAMVAA